MPELKLKHPVTTLDGKVLLHQGTELTPTTMNSLVTSGNAGSLEFYPLLGYQSVKTDLIIFLGKSPYDTIFSSHDNISSLLGEMEHIKLPLPVLESLSYFKKHDSSTYRHILMVFALSILLARDLIPDLQERIRLASAGPTHDMGKICVPLDILRKGTALTHEERDIVHHHSLAGYVLLSYYYGDTAHDAPRVARDHHERMDGSGYPLGIHLRDKHTEIIAAVDVYDALISSRPYRPTSYDNRTALEEITIMAKKGMICQDCVMALVAHNRKSKPFFEDARVSDERRGKPPSGNVYGIEAGEAENTESSPHALKRKKTEEKKTDKG